MENYKLHELELAEYTRILPSQSGINACIYIDECESYVRWKHPLWVIISDKNPYTNPWVALSVSDNPQILVYGNQSSNVKNILSWLEPCTTFVSKFHNIIENISNEHIDSDIIYNILSKYNWEKLTINNINNLQISLSDDLFLLAETILRTQITKLPFSIWIEPGKRQTNHNIPRIKFQDSDDKTSTSFYPILLTPTGSEILEENDKRSCKAKGKDKREVIKFVNTYRNIIDAFINEEINEPQLKQFIKNKKTKI